MVFFKRLGVILLLNVLLQLIVTFGFGYNLNYLEAALFGIIIAFIAMGVIYE